MGQGAVYNVLLLAGYAGGGGPGPDGAQSAPSVRLIPRPWNGKRLGAAVDAGTAAGDPFRISWAIDPEVDLPSGNYDAVMAFEVLYYGFSENAEGAALGFTKWRIRNGLDNSRLDYTDSPGGAVFVRIGGGCGGDCRCNRVEGAEITLEYHNGKIRTMTQEADLNGPRGGTS